MKRLPSTLLVIAGLIMMGIMVSTAASTKADSAQAKAKKAELEHLRQTIQELSESLDTLRSQHRDERSKLHTLNRKINRLSRSLRDLENQRRHQSQSLDRLQDSRQASRDQLAVQQRKLSHLLRAAYLLGQQSPLKILLNSTEPATVERSLRYYDYFYRSRAEHIAEINDTLAKLSGLEEDIRDKRHKLDALVKRQRTQRETLRQSRNERKQLLADLNRDIQNAEQRLTRLKEDEQSLQELVKRLGRALAKIPSPGKSIDFARLKGRLPLPAPGPIIAHFGTPRQVGQLKWQGILIDAADGADVKAVAAGRVVFADWLRGFGLLIIIDHGDGYMSLYGYNQDLRYNVGDDVTAGEVIATVGNNGSHQSGLYFEIRHQGTPINPLHWCKSP